MRLSLVLAVLAVLAVAGRMRIWAEKRIIGECERRGPPSERRRWGHPEGFGRRHHVEQDESDLTGMTPSGGAVGTEITKVRKQVEAVAVDNAPDNNAADEAEGPPGASG